jgi:S-adenosylmethionine-diacylglycerol 3-amino-3-carboxypropyl transferase
MAVLKDANHNILRYACCWEDADLLLQGLSPVDGGTVLSIGSGGDNTFSLLSQNPEKVVCLDVNKVQLATVRLKMAAFKSLTHAEFLEFLGFAEGDALRYWQLVQKELSAEDVEFWESSAEWISSRLMRQGKFEKYLLLFQQKVLPWIHSRKKVEELFKRKPEQEQFEFYEHIWNNWRWRIFTRIFFSRPVMGRVGRDPEFLKQVKGNVGEKIKKRINGHLKSTACQQNYFLKFMLQGDFGESLPHYARAENFEKIKANLHKLEFFEGPLEDYPQKEEFTHANLSNIFEYQSEKEFAKNTDCIYRLLKQGGTVAYWNLMVPRDLAVVQPNNFKSLPMEGLKPDFGFFYRSFNLSRKL